MNIFNGLADFLSKSCLTSSSWVTHSILFFHSYSTFIYLRQIFIGNEMCLLILKLAIQFFFVFNLIRFAELMGFFFKILFVKVAKQRLTCKCSLLTLSTFLNEWKTWQFNAKPFSGLVEFLNLIETKMLGSDFKESKILAKFFIK